MEEEVGAVFELGWTSPTFRSLIGTNNGIGSLGRVQIHDRGMQDRDHYERNSRPTTTGNLIPWSM